jgi:hypothetical protein
MTLQFGQIKSFNGYSVSPQKVTLQYKGENTSLGQYTGASTLENDTFTASFKAANADFSISQNLATSNSQLTLSEEVNTAPEAKSDFLKDASTLLEKSKKLFDQKGFNKLDPRLIRLVIENILKSK